MKLVHQDWQALCARADEKMKQSNGHNFVQILKTRCTRCGRGPNHRGKCRFWFLKLLDEIYLELTHR